MSIRQNVIDNTEQNGVEIKKLGNVERLVIWKPTRVIPPQILTEPVWTAQRCSEFKIKTVVVSF